VSASVLNHIVVSGLCQSSALRQRVVATEAMLINQFFGPAAASRAGASIALLRGGRQYTATVPLPAESPRSSHTLAKGSGQGGTRRVGLKLAE
jgi:hypothetical protein